MSDAWKYRPVFLSANGPGPWPCYHHDCDELVQPEDLVIHHLDENHHNHDPLNLVAMHSGCHSRLHFAGVPRSAETRALISAAKIGKKRQPATDEYRAKMSAIKKGTKLTDDHRRKLSEAVAAYWQHKREAS